MMDVDQALSWSELAAVVHGLVLEGRKTIEDRLSRVMAYSRLQQHADPARVETILDRQAPERLRALFDARGVSAHLAASDEPIFVAADAELRMTGRMVVAALRAGRYWARCGSPVRRRWTAPPRGIDRWRAHGGPAPAALTRQRGLGTPGRIRAGHPVAGGHSGRRDPGQQTRVTDLGLHDARTRPAMMIEVTATDDH